MNSPAEISFKTLMEKEFLKTKIKIIYYGSDDNYDYIKIYKNTYKIKKEENTIIEGDRTLFKSWDNGVVLSQTVYIDKNNQYKLIFSKENKK